MYIYKIIKSENKIINYFKIFFSYFEKINFFLFIYYFFFYLQNIAGHCLCFFLLMVGNGILLENSSINSNIQESIKTSMKNLIINSYDSHVSQTLNLIQEEVSIT